MSSINGRIIHSITTSGPIDLTREPFPVVILPYTAETLKQVEVKYYDESDIADITDETATYTLYDEYGSPVVLTDTSQPVKIDGPIILKFTEEYPDSLIFLAEEVDGVLTDSIGLSASVLYRLLDPSLREIVFIDPITKRDAADIVTIALASPLLNKTTIVGSASRGIAIYAYGTADSTLTKASKALGSTYSPATVATIAAMSGCLGVYDFIPGADLAVLYDKSGNDRHGALATAPNNPEWMTDRGAAFFKSESTRFTIPASAIVSGNNSLSVVVVGHIPQLYNNTGLYNCIFGYGASAGLHAAPSIHINIVTPAGVQLRTGGGDNLTLADTVGLSSNAITMRYNHVDTELSGAVNNGEYSAKNLSGALAADTSLGAKIGAYSNTNADPLNGFVFGLASFNRLITDDERAIIGAVLGDKEENDLVVFDGNSLTAGTPLYDMSSYPHQCMTSIRDGWDWYQFGVAGQTTTQMLSDFDTQISPLFNNRRPKQILIAWEIGNELLSLGADQAHTNFKNYCLHARSVLPANTKIVVCNVTPRTTAGFNTLRASANSLMNAQWATYADAQVDLAGDSRIGPDGAENDTTYYQADKTHMTAAGYAVVAELVKAGILSVSA